MNIINYIKNVLNIANTNRYILKYLKHVLKIYLQNYLYTYITYTCS